MNDSLMLAEFIHYKNYQPVNLSKCTTIEFEVYAKGGGTISFFLGDQVVRWGFDDAHTGIRVAEEITRRYSTEIHVNG